MKTRKKKKEIFSQTKEIHSEWSKNLIPAHEFRKDVPSRAPRGDERDWGGDEDTDCKNLQQAAVSRRSARCSYLGREPTRVGEQPFGQGHPLQPEEGGVLLNCTLSYLWFIFDGVTGAALCWTWDFANNPSSWRPLPPTWRCPISPWELELDRARVLCARRTKWPFKSVRYWESFHS